jgi:hypothetical protein
VHLQCREKEEALRLQEERKEREEGMSSITSPIAAPFACLFRHCGGDKQPIVGFGFGFWAPLQYAAPDWTPSSPCRGTKLRTKGHEGPRVGD